MNRQIGLEESSIIVYNQKKEIMASHVKKSIEDSSEQGSKNAEDRISALPDSLLHHILSFLEMREVIATGLLSRRWRYLWMSTPTLDFGDWYGWDHTPIVIALLRYEGTSISKFRIRCNLPVDDRSHVDSWIRYLVRFNVGKLDLDFALDEPWGNKKPYKLHQCLFTSGSLEVLRLKFCNLNLPTYVHLHLLKTIELSLLELTDVDIKLLISGCPLLENMSLVKCTSNTEFNIFAPSPNMKSLRIHDLKYYYKKGAGIEIFAPYLLSLELSGYSIQKYKIINLSSIVSVSIDFERMLCYKYDGEDDHLVGLLSGLSCAKDFKLCGWCVQVLGTRMVVGTNSPFIHTTYLELKTGLSKRDTLGIAFLLRSAHHLESLIIGISEKKELSSGNLSDRSRQYEFDIREHWKLLEISLSCQLFHLKTVKIYGFMGSKSLSWEEYRCMDVDKFIASRENEVELVSFLLRNSKMLDKMIIRTTKEADFRKCALKSEILLKLHNSLLQLRKASQNAEIVFS